MGGFWPELPVFADGHHNQQVAQDAHEHDQWQEADESNRLHQPVAVGTERRHRLSENHLNVWNDENTDKCHSLKGDSTGLTIAHISVPEDITGASEMLLIVHLMHLK